MRFLFQNPILILAALIALPASASEKIDTEPEPLVTTDPVTVYQKAFWRHPQSDDQIKHAERREWLDTDGNVLKWQWFLVVEPSPQTQAWLETNPFFLSPLNQSERSPSLAEPPEWFDLNQATSPKLQNASGTQILAHSPDGKRLYATDSGSGFAPEN